jgi:uncharacterized protein YecE (DUF72 family)
MIAVACSGFPVPQSRYFKELLAVEISDTELGIPGQGTCRRWLREAAPGFEFSLLAPKQIAGEGFALSPENKQARDEVTAFAKQLKSRAIVFAASADFGPTRENRTRLRAFATHVQRVARHAVLDLPGWPLKEAEATLKKLPVGLAFDPLTEEPADSGDLLYARLPGPSGYRSRYDHEALDRVVDYCKASKAKNLFVVFRNIDRFENSVYVAKRLQIA